MKAVGLVQLPSKSKKAAYLVLLEPLLEKLLSPLGKYGTSELKRLMLVKLSLLEEDTKILEDRRQRAGLNGNLLELLNSLRRSQNALEKRKRDKRHVRNRHVKYRNKIETRTRGELAAIFAASAYIPVPNS